MHPAVKVLVGLVLILIGLGLFVDSVVPISGVVGTFGIDWLGNFVTVLTGVIPIFLIIVGLFVVWLEIDEIKAQKEIKSVSKKKKSKKTKKKKKK